MGQRRRTRVPRRIVLLVATVVLLGLAVYGVLRWVGWGGLALAAGIMLAAALLVGWVMELTGRLAPPMTEEELAGIADPKAQLEAADARVRLRNDLRNGAFQLLLVVAALAGALLGFQQLAADRDRAAVDRDQAAADRELTQQGQASERFTRAIDQLGSTRVETRVGGIYGVAQIAEQASENIGPVGEVLVAFVNRQPRPKSPPRYEPVSEHAPDLQAALTVLTTSDRNNDGQKDYGWIVGRLDLHGLNLRGAALQGAALQGAVLTSAFLTDANLTDANLTDANLSDAVFPRANLAGASLAGASLNGATLRDAILTRVILTRADLTAARLPAADLTGANLSGANLSSAKLRGADLFGANLNGAKLNNTNLTRTNLTDADLTDADLTGARCGLVGCPSP